MALRQLEPRANTSGPAELQPRLEWLLLATGCTMLLALSRDISGDGYVRFRSVRALIEQGIVTDDRYSLVFSALASPFYLVGRAVGEPERVVALLNPVLVVLAIVTTYFVLSPTMDRAVLRRFLVLVTVGSMFAHHVQTSYGEVITALGFLVGISLYGRDSRRCGAAFLTVAVVNTPAAMVALVLVELHEYRVNRRWQPSVIVISTAAALIIGEAWLRRGAPLSLGYEGDRGFETILPYSGQTGFSYPIVFGIFALTLSFGKGVAFFAPGLWLAFSRPSRSMEATTRHLYHGLMASLGGLIVVYGGWWSWYGGWYWGPRFLLLASLPASLLVASRLGDLPKRALGKFGLAGLLAASIWVGANGAVFGQRNMDVCQQANFQMEHLCWFVPEFSALARPFVAPSALSFLEIALLAYFAAAFLVLTQPIIAALIEQIRTAEPASKKTA